LFAHFELYEILNSTEEANQRRNNTKENKNITITNKFSMQAMK